MQDQRNSRAYVRNAISVSNRQPARVAPDFYRTPRPDFIECIGKVLTGLCLIFLVACVVACFIPQDQLTPNIVPVSEASE